MDLKILVEIGEGYTRERVMEEIHAEQYPYIFYFSLPQGKSLLDMNEIWLFGRVPEEKIKYYKELGCDLWIMG